MGQLEVYAINETFFVGLITNIFINYLAESEESSTFESFKAYLYSSNFSKTKKIRSILKSDLLVIMSDSEACNS
jgi:hypothetical protein